MKPEAQSTDKQLREVANKLLASIFEKRYKEAEDEAKTVLVLIDHLNKKSQR